MILVDSSVWIDYLRGTGSWQTDALDAALGGGELIIGDLILAEVLQGFSFEKDYRNALELFDTLEFINLGGKPVALEAAKNFRKLRSLGFTVRKTIDTIIATRCIMSGFELLHNDRDFDPFEKHLGLSAYR